MRRRTGEEWRKHPSMRKENNVIRQTKKGCANTYLAPEKKINALPYSTTVRGVTEQ